jgi:nitrogen regulatory protein PII
MFKLVVAYIDSSTFESVRSALVEYGIASFSAVAAGAVSDYAFAAPNYRGSAHTQRLPEKLRLECVVGASHVDAVKNIIFEHEGRRSFLYVLDVEQAFPEDSVMASADTEASAAES